MDDATGWATCCERRQQMLRDVLRTTTHMLQPWDYMLHATMADATTSRMTCCERRGRMLYPLRQHVGTGNGGRCDPWDDALQAVGRHAARVVTTRVEVMTVEATLLQRATDAMTDGTTCCKTKSHLLSQSNIIREKKKEKYPHESQRKINDV